MEEIATKKARKQTSTTTIISELLVLDVVIWIVKTIRLSMKQIQVSRLFCRTEFQVHQPDGILLGLLQDGKATFRNMMHLSFFLILITQEDGPILHSDQSTVRKRNMLVISHQLELRLCHEVSPMEHVLLMGGSFTTMDGSRTSLTNLHMSEAQQHSRI